MTTHDTRPTILIFLRCYLPGEKSGGPVRSIANLVERLGDDFQFKVVTTDRDSGEVAPYPHIQSGRWYNRGKTQVLYLPPQQHSLRVAKAILHETPSKLIYLNSLFNRFFTIYPILATRNIERLRQRVVLAPRGELDRGALAIKSTKKKYFLAAARKAGLYRTVTWHATNEAERDQIHRRFSPTEPIHCVSNLTSRFDFTEELVPAFREIGSRTEFPSDQNGFAHCPSPETRPLRTAFDDSQQGRTKANGTGPLRMAFLSRLVPKKNLAGALRTLEQVRVPVLFDIYGPAEDRRYESQCRQLAAKLPSNIQVNFRGPIDHSRVVETLRQYDVFFFPTLGENFGHVIVEALAAGCIAIISDQTPWRDLELNGAGWDIAVDRPDLFAAAIEQCATMDREVLIAMKRRALAMAQEQFDSTKNTVERYRTMFHSVLDAGKERTAESEERRAGRVDRQEKDRMTNVEIRNKKAEIS